MLTKSLREAREQWWIARAQEMEKVAAIENSPVPIQWNKLSIFYHSNNKHQWNNFNLNIVISLTVACDEIV